MTENTAITTLKTFNASEYAIFQPNASNDLREAIQMNLENGVSKRQLFTKIPMPLGGGTIFNYATADGEVAAQSITGIVIHVQTEKAMFLGAYGASKFPQCSSPDGNIGYGEPGGSCLTCPNNEFGPNNGRKPCTEKKQIYVLMKDDILPIVISAASQSFTPWKEYNLMLMRKGLTTYKVETTFSLENSIWKQDNKTKVSKLKFTMGSKIQDQDLIRHIQKLRDDIIPFLSEQPLPLELQAA